ncbi:MAG: BrxE family protein [Candidatus Accumulibacter phosphatis]|uniref:BrxE family protein n=1 Tax=Candidatus Accumulibacter sp. ACC012 TaxID=2823332 RepID=UPI0025BD0B50|nr:BrxE family protein [Candidatus Accumulibacter sp. ACC012]
MSDHLKESYLPTLLRLRLLVGFLGERAQFAWWPTAFYEPSSRLFLEPVFSKTSRLAQYHGVLEAARRLHDEHLSVGTYHLFRLPEETEQDLHTMLQSSAADGLVSQVPTSKEPALDSLRRLAGTCSPNSVGPTAVGNIKELDSDDVLTAIASAYWSAFSQSTRTYPYLVS